jgi:hypothetical protein
MAAGDERLSTHTTLCVKIKLCELVALCLAAYDKLPPFVETDESLHQCSAQREERKPGRESALALWRMRRRHRW